MRARRGSRSGPLGFVAVVLALWSTAWAQSRTPPEPILPDFGEALTVPTAPTAEHPAAPDDNAFAEVVFLSARRPQPLREAAASTSVITAADLAAYGWTDFSEAIASLAGFYVTDPRDSEYIGVRGISFKGDNNGRVLILVDGHTQQELWSHSAYPGMLGLDAALVDHIEVLRGPASSLYGSLGFLAIINVVTRRGLPGEYARATVTTTDARDFRAALSVGHRFGALEVGLAASATLGLGRSFTYPDLVASDGTDVGCVPGFASSCTRGVSRAETDAAQGLAVYGHADWKGLTLKASWQTLDKHIPFAPYGTIFNDTTNHFVTGRGYVDLGWRVGTPETAQLFVRGYYDTATYADDLVYAPDMNHTSRYVFHDEAHPWWSGGEVQLLAVRELGRLRATGTLGGEGTFLHGDDQSGDVGGANPVVIGDNIVYGAVYGQLELAWARWAALTLGLRGDFADISPSAFSPRAGLVVFPHETTTVKLLYGHGFIHPSWYELFFDDKMSITNNAALQPESADNYELVLQQQLGPSLFLTGSLFYIVGDHLIEQTNVCLNSDGSVTTMPTCAADTPARRQSQNVHAFSSLGGELGVAGRWKGGTRLFANYSYADATLDGNLWPIDSPRHLAKAGFAMPLWRDHLWAGVEARYTSPRHLSSDPIPPQPPPVPVETDAHLYLAAHVSWRDLPRGFEAMLKVSDLTGQTWTEPSVTESSDPIVRIPHQGPYVTLRVGYAY